jgi:hypothetical protein
VEAFVTILQKSAEAPVHYRLGDRETKDLDELGRWLAQTKERADAAKVPVAARIYASNFTPHAEVVKVLEEFTTLGFTEVEFFGGGDVSKRLPWWPESDVDSGR